MVNLPAGARCRPAYPDVDDLPVSGGALRLGSRRHPAVRPHAQRRTVELPPPAL